MPLPIAAFSAPDVVFIILAAPLFSLGSRAAWKVWRGDYELAPSAPVDRRRRRRQSDELRRRQALPVSALGCDLLIVAFVVQAIWGIQATGPKIAFLVTVLTAFRAMFIGMSLMYTGRPRWAIPPAMRPGRERRAP